VSLDAEIARRRKRAGLTSATGAGVLGAGIGVVLYDYLGPYGLLLILLGAFVHGWGMLDGHRLERRAGDERLAWAEALYWICWVGLALFAAYVVAQV
jgi:hypothetical protein